MAAEEAQAAAAAEEAVKSAAEQQEEAPASEEAVKELEAEAIAAAEAVAASGEAVGQSGSFKEESNRVADLSDPEKKALEELKKILQSAWENNEFAPAPPAPPPAAAAAEDPAAAKPAEEDPKPAAADSEPAPAAAAAEEAAAPPAESVAVEPPAEATAASDVVDKPAEATEETVAAAAAEPTADAAPPAPETEATAVEISAAPASSPPEEVLIWGVPLLGDERSDTVLLKFLRARDFKAKEALIMIKNAVAWRRTFGIEALLEEDLGLPELNKVVFTNGSDKEGHPVCYNIYGEFHDKDLYAKAFGDEEKRQRFLRWRIQFLEREIRQQLDFAPGGISTILQVTDLKNSPGVGKRELRQATNQALALLQDNYPEFVAKQVFINVPWWYLAFNRVISPFLTQRTKSKFVFAGPAKTGDTLFKYIAPEQVPIKYGGLNKENDPDFTTSDAVTEIAIKPSAKQTIEIPITEATHIVWELRVLGWDVTYGAEFTPSAEGAHSVIVQKARKLASTDEPVVNGSFNAGEPGKIVLSVENSSRKKKLLYRSKAKNSGAAAPAAPDAAPAVPDAAAADAAAADAAATTEAA